ncbi:hypothetical protein [Akkermansia sp.]|uniref:hypothetical protein n=1 Tax=Akkermansia sp. TaxID=1872421 RepID=UPI0025B82015|nr:hypothetical protein [Akkermansia sp.]MCC8148258.1 hypothetical protein [Akkermansia sp.]
MKKTTARQQGRNRHAGSSGQTSLFLYHAQERGFPEWDFPFLHAVTLHQIQGVPAFKKAAAFHPPVV